MSSNEMICISNDYLDARVSLIGGEIYSLKSREGIEYIWQGDPQYWRYRAVNLFPYVGRMAEKGGIYNGKICKMKLHGFLMDSRMTADQVGEHECELLICANDETKTVFPYDFELRIKYILADRSLIADYSVLNLSPEDMYFSIGGHPGFNIPLEQGKSFEDYEISFPKGTALRWIEMDNAGIVTGRRLPFPYKREKSISLQHTLFYHDAVVFDESGGTVSLRTDGDSHGFTLHYDDFRYIGLWQTKDAPFLCFEPWSALPAGYTDVENMREKESITILKPFEKANFRWSVDTW